MKLNALASATGTSAASIKYYLRLGLLRPGQKKNATTAVYDDTHVERLELITALRRIVGLSIAQITELVALIDDPAVGILTVMETAQVMASGTATRDSEASPPGSRGSRRGQGGGNEDSGAGGRGSSGGSSESDGGGGTGSRESVSGNSGGDGSGSPAAAPADRVAGIIAERGWPDATTAARAALERVLGDMSTLGIVPSDAYLTRASRALDSVSTGDFDFGGSRDRIAMGVAVGTHAYSRLVVALLQLSQTSRSIAEFATEAGHMARDGWSTPP